MNKRVLITGSSRGIGLAIAKYIENLDYEIILHAKSDSKHLQEVCEYFKSKNKDVKTLIFDVSNTIKTQEILLNDIENNGAYYGVVLNAGISKDNTFVGLSKEDWFSVIDVNLNSFYNVLKPILLPMIRRKKHGRIITISSVSGIIGNRGQVNYSASKAGIIGATKALAIELASRNITVNCVAPGLIETDMLNSDLPLEEIMKAIPAKRAGFAKEVASLVGFLLSSESSYITKQVIGVNGGLC